jgi:pimeloyl-ACP methyl ester carboxylesterase
MPTLDFDGVALQFEDEGSGEPVVLVHGFPFTADLWTPQRAALSASYRIITPNLRGFGGSDQHFGTPSLDVYADDIIAILDELGVAEVTVVGLSMGGYIAMALLRRRPDRVRGSRVATI